MLLFFRREIFESGRPALGFRPDLDPNLLKFGPKVVDFHFPAFLDLKKTSTIFGAVIDYFLKCAGARCAWQYRDRKKVFRGI